MKYLIIFWLTVFPVIGSAQAQWPGKPITIIVPYSPGGGSDQQARLVAQYISKTLDKPVTVENIPGGNLIIALNKFIKSDPNHTFMLADSGIVTGPASVNNHEYQKIMPISIWASAPAVFFRNPTVDPDKLRRDINEKQTLQVATPVLTLPASQWIMNLKPLKVQPVPYNGSENVSAVMLNHVSYGVTSLATAWNWLHQQQVIPIMVSSDERVAGLPNVPTYRELGFEGRAEENWWGLMALTSIDAKNLNTLEKILHQMIDQDAKIQDLSSKGISIKKRSRSQSSIIYRSTIQKTHQ